MSKKELSNRLNWERVSGERAASAEQNLYKVFEKAFEGTVYKLYRKPKHLKNLYAKVKLSEDVLKKIYNPDIDYENTEWGVSPDFAIENTVTHKILFGEIKRQDGWVEGKDPSAGRGNAHERLCKMFTPGLIQTYRTISGITDENVLPFWVVFEGDITRDPKRVREITFWFDKFENNFYMWRPNESYKGILQHFNEHLKCLIDQGVDIQDSDRVQKKVDDLDQ